MNIQATPASTLGAMPPACAESVPVPGHEPSLLPSGRSRSARSRSSCTATATTSAAAGRSARRAGGPPSGYGEKIGGGEGEAVSQVEEFLLLSTEAKWYRNKGMTGEGVPEPEEAWQAGDAFEVDYVRVFDEVAAEG